MCGLYVRNGDRCLCSPLVPNDTIDTGCYPISVEDLMKTDKRVSELEDKVKILEEALEESEAELAYKEAQLALALELALKAHDLRTELDSAKPYNNQPLLPLGDIPE